MSSVFEVLNSTDLSEKSKEKNGLTYISWASAWAEVKKLFPNATYTVNPQAMDELGNTRFWHDDGKTGWVDVSVTIEDLTYREVLAIMDFRNKSIPADQITSVDANKSMKRCLVKALAMHGLGLYIYQGEELPEEISKIAELQEEIAALAKKKSAISDNTKAKVIALCKDAEREANPWQEDSLITGKIANIGDLDILEKLNKQLLAVRK